MPPRKKPNYAEMYSFDPKTELYYASRTIHGKVRKFRSKDPEKLHEKVVAAENAPPPVLTFGMVAEEWQERKWEDLATKTSNSYNAPYKRAMDALGDRPINEITPAEVDRIIQRMKNQGYSAKTVKAQKSMVKMIFTYAITHDPPYTMSNPAEYVQIPRGLPRKKRSAPDDATMQTIIDSVRTAYFGLFPFLLLYTGCRRGEALALTWGDVDFKEKSIRISKEYIYPNGMPVLKPPKTEAGIRTVPLLPGLRAVLVKPRGAKPTDLVFPAPDGRPLQENAFRRRWRHYCKDAGLVSDVVEIKTRKNGQKYEYHHYEPIITPHQLRHGYATILYEADIDAKTSQTFLGHADIHTTLQIYTDLRDKQRAAQVIKLEDHMKRYDGISPTRADTKTASG